MRVPVLSETLLQQRRPRPVNADAVAGTETVTDNENHITVGTRQWARQRDKT